jgi:hypothetical protein
MSTGKVSVSTKNVEAVAKWPTPTTRKEARNFVHFCNFYAKLIHHFSDLTASLTDLQRKAKPLKVAMTLACLKAFETVKLRFTMLDPSGRHLGCDVHRGFKCFDSGDCISNVARLVRKTSIILLWGTEAESN